MTFEEFFIKKKIDLELLKKAEPGLYAEFESHFNQMGEKSFDHTKKFWFNKLRHLYHLVTPEKALTQVENKVASQAEPLGSPTIEQKAAPAEQASESTLSKPGFKPRNIAARSSENAVQPTETKDIAAEPIKKPGFKPRNIKTPAEDAKTVDSLPGQTVTPETPAGKPLAEEEHTKPAYKPRFNPKNIPQQKASTEEKPKEESQKEPDAPSIEETTPAPKPAYKPRFNPKNIPQQKASTEEKAKEESQKEPDAPSIEETTPAPKPAYKPRFNPKNIPQQKASPEEKTEDTSETGDNQGLPTQDAADSKPAYKPRFNMKNIKPKED